MANTSVILSNEQGVLVPSPSTVPVTSGDTIIFESNGSPAFLFFSPAAAAILSPHPSSPVDITANPAQFAFISSDPGAYSVYFETTAGSTVPAFPVSVSNLLMLETDTAGVSFGVYNDRTKG